MKFKSSKLHLEDTDISKIIERYPTPFYLYSERELKNNYTEFHEAAKSLNSEIEICFALKSNPNKFLLEILSSLGAGADIVSGGELTRALESGIPASKIVFSGVGKTKAEIEQALEANIYSFNVESIEELEMINNLAAQKSKPAQVAFRLNPKVEAITHKYISTGYKTHKFGLLEKDILDAIANEELWTHTKLIGVSVHIGSQLTCLKATGEAFVALSQCVAKIPFKLEFVDLGGGLGVNYSKIQEPKAPALSEYMNVINKNLKIDYPVKIVFEPGRKIIASAGMFITSVIRTKKSEDCNFIIVDGGMNDFARPSLYQAYHEIFPSLESSQLITTDIVGPICETADCFGEKRELPALNTGDFLAIADTGAYGFSMSSNYNLRSKPKEILLTTSGEPQLIES
jgi:diaminopimelate decarboxylase